MKFTTQKLLKIFAIAAMLVILGVLILRQINQDRGTELEPVSDDIIQTEMHTFEIGNLPIPRGAEIISEDISEDGRSAEIQLSYSASSGALTDYYKTTLTSQGWTLDAGTTLSAGQVIPFVQNGVSEGVLTIVQSTNEDSLIIFSLTRK